MIELFDRNSNSKQTISLVGKFVKEENELLAYYESLATGGASGTNWDTFWDIVN